MAKTRLGRLTVDVMMKTAGIDKGTREGRKKFREFDKSVSNFEKNFKRSMLAIGAAVTGAAVSIGVIVKKEIELISTQADLARSMNATVTGLRAVNKMAADNSISGLDSSLARLTRRLGAVEHGSGPAVKAVEALQLNIKEINDADADRKIAIISDAIRNAGISSAQATRYLQDLGFQQAGVFNLFSGGSEEVEKYREEIEKSGQAISEVDATKIQIANQAFNDLGESTKGLKTELSVELTGAFMAVTNMINEFTKKGEDGNSRVAKAVEKTLEITIKLANALETVWRGAKVAFGVVEAGVGVLGGAFSWAGEKISGISGAIGGAVGDAFDWVGLTTDLGNRNREMWGIMGDIAGDGVEFFTNRIKHGVDLTRDTLDDAMHNPPDWGFTFVLEPLIRAGKQLDDEVDELNKKAEEIKEIFSGTSDDTGDNIVKLGDKEKAQLRSQVEALLEYGKDRHTIIQEQFEAELEFVEEAYENELLTEEEHTDALLASAKKRADALAEIEEESARQRERIMARAFGAAQQLMGSHSRKMFELGKVAAITQAIQNTAVGITEAWKLGPILGPPMAALVGAAGFAQVQQLKRQKFGGSGSNSSATETSANVEAAAPQRSVQDIHIQGIDPDSFFSGEQIINAVNAGITAGGRIVGIG